ncbi:uncharacterized protein LOC117650868 [Thrips palmi]|uniref:Uncharacterized protein LOC117650868 n=1 Tax=Thrips palmi TaxID=161013 RepID=A0A6P8ZY90_THRPL|nr:uncharacterized protein LOC117650868 [Thrips palmi]
MNTCILLVVAVAACLVPSAMSACNSRQLDNLEKQLTICGRNLPVQQYGGSWQWSRSVTSTMKKESTCNLNNAPDHFQAALENSNIGKASVDRAVTCIKNAIRYSVCC